MRIRTEDERFITDMPDIAKRLLRLIEDADLTTLEIRLGKLNISLERHEVLGLLDAALAEYERNSI